MNAGPTQHEETTMQAQRKSAAMTVAELPSHPAYRDERLQQQVSTYLLYRSFSTDERNRRGLAWWRETQRHQAEGAP
jgi:hypothetical protein